MTTRVDRGKKVLHMMPDGGRDVFLEFLFSLVLGVLFQLVGNVCMNRLSAADGNKVISPSRSPLAFLCRRRMSRPMDTLDPRPRPNCGAATRLEDPGNRRWLSGYRKCWPCSSYRQRFHRWNQSLLASPIRASTVSYQTCGRTCHPQCRSHTP